MPSKTLLLVLLTWGCRQAAGPAVQEVVVVPPGATVRAVAESLETHGIIRSPFWFRMLTKFRGKERQLQRGAYAFRRGIGSGEALDALIAGKSILQRLTIPEGLTLIDIAHLVDSALAVPQAAFLAAARDTALLREYGIPGPSLEGYLRPETYLMAPGLDARKVVRVLANRFVVDWKPEWDTAARAQGLDRHTVVTLASIVETEAQVDSDRPLIASVYRNRLRLGMPLQADATVQYAIQVATGTRKTRLYEKDYGFPSPYNTYLTPGLPPGPVGAPGTKSIEAVLSSAQAPYLYYVARSDGTHIFSRTYREHLRAIQTSRARARLKPK